MKAGIVGSGIMGRLLAFSLIHEGWDVTLFDRGEAINCSTAAAGLLSPLSELEKNDLIIFQLGKEALEQHWPAILNKLQKKIYFQRQGSLLLSHSKDRSDLMKCMKIISNKLSHENFYKKLNQDEIIQMEPDISRFNEGYFFSDEGQIDNQSLLMALRNDLIEKKVTWFENTTVSHVEPGKVISSDKTYTFDWVFDCRGLGSKIIFDDLRSVRGELIWLHAPAVFINRPIRFMHPRYSLYIVPRPNQEYLIGASEIESDDLSDISVRTTLELLTAAYYINSNFGEARIIKTVVHCRPTLSTNLPKIKYSEGLIAINGLYRHGFLIAPTLVHDIMQWIRQKKMTRYVQLWERYS